jgi:hypothetical protein
MSPQRFAVLAVLCGTLVLNGWVAAGLVGLGSRSIENDRPQIAVDTPQATVIAENSVDRISANAIIDAAFSDLGQMPPAVQIASANTPDQVQKDVEASALPFEVPEMESILAALPDLQGMLAPVAVASVSTSDAAQRDAEPLALEATEIVGTALPDPREILPPTRFALASGPDPVHDDVEASAPAVEVAEIGSIGAPLPDAHEVLPPATPPVRLVSLFRSDLPEEDLKPAVRVVETPNECLVVEICIDDYLWSFYERTPKVDTNKVKERVKATVRKKGKTRTVIKTVTRYVVADFTWKDPIAAEKAGMSVKDYVIGGMDRRFKLRLYHALRAMDDAGFMPGITSAFRDDYRQAIASGNKAASDSSYHGGSRRGGYGHGLAVDLVSVKGETRLQRFASTVELWKWVDAREKELGIGRPYLDRDPPHVAPIDGKEFATKRGGARAKLAGSATNKRPPVAAAGKADVTKPTTGAGSVRVGSI